jgi:hypothetical protein
VIPFLDSLAIERFRSLIKGYFIALKKIVSLFGGKPPKKQTLGWWMVNILTFFLFWAQTGSTSMPF